MNWSASLRGMKIGHTSSWHQNFKTNTSCPENLAYFTIFHSRYSKFAKYLLDTIEYMGDKTEVNYIFLIFNSGYEKVEKFDKIS